MKARLKRTKLCSRCSPSQQLKSNFYMRDTPSWRRIKSPRHPSGGFARLAMVHDRRHELEGRPRRKDCASLLQLHHNAVHFDRKELDRIINETIMIADLFGERSSGIRSS